MLASGFIVGAFSLVGRASEGSGSTVWPVPALVGLALSAMLFGAAVTWTLLAGRLKKISVRRFLK
jgi:hypothetical protein